MSVGLSTAGPGAAKSGRASNVIVLRSLFARDVDGLTGGRYFDRVLSNGAYTYLETFSPGAGAAGTLINEHTGRQRDVAGCVAGVFGGPWLLLDCQTTQRFLGPELYSLASGKWRTSPYAGDATAIGKYWIESDGDGGCDAEPPCAPPERKFINIQTGRQRPDPTNASTVADLNIAKLAHPICRPLRVPRVTVFEPFLGPEGPNGYEPSSSGEYLKIWGSLTFYGPFAFPTAGRFGGSPATLRSCGHGVIAHLPKMLGPTVGTSQVVVWQSGRQQLAGVFLPSARRFTITLPSSIDGVDQLALSDRTLYVLDDNLQLWTTKTPGYKP